MKWYVLDVNPEPWRVGPASVGRINGKLVPQIGRDQQLASYQEAIREALGTALPPMIEGKVKLKLFFWRNRAEYETPQARRHRKHEADVTNLAKATEDALQGLLFDNDRDTNTMLAVMVEQGPDVRGRVVVGVEPAPMIPDAVNLIPDHVWLEMQERDNKPDVPKQDRLSWGDDHATF